MLVLTRKQDQTIRVGNNVTITILKVRGNTVRIGIDAPREIPVVRGELDRDLIENEAAHVTVEFKSNSEMASNGPSLRVVTEETEQTTALPICDSENRLQQLVAKVSHAAD